LRIPRKSGFEKGGGRKLLIASTAALDENFSALVAEFTAGDPMRQGMLWTNLSRR